MYISEERKSRLVRQRSVSLPDGGKRKPWQTLGLYLKVATKNLSNQSNLSNLSNLSNQSNLSNLSNLINLSTASGGILLPSGGDSF